MTPLRVQKYDVRIMFAVREPPPPPPPEYSCVYCNLPHASDGLCIDCWQMEHMTDEGMC
jgi:hypothetical protein